MLSFKTGKTRSTIINNNNGDDSGVTITNNNISNRSRNIIINNNDVSNDNAISITNNNNNNNFNEDESFFIINNNQISFGTERVIINNNNNSKVLSGTVISDNGRPIAAVTGFVEGIPVISALNTKNFDNPLTRVPNGSQIIINKMIMIVDHSQIDTILYPILVKTQ